VTTLDDLWPGIESAAPDSPGPLVVAADCADEEGLGTLAYALRWAAGHSKRPLRRAGISRFPWRWIRAQASYRSLSKKALVSLAPCVVPQPVFDAMPNRDHRGEWCLDLRDSTAAYEYLASALAQLRAAVEVPAIVVPPQPSLVAMGPVECAACGILRSRGRLDCPVCGSSEVKP
jgi:hypothetical protein